MSEKVLATIDLGSNSFHMLISSVTEVDGKKEITTLCRDKYKVQLRSGLDEQGNLTEAVKQRALKSLKKFVNSIQKYQVTEIKVLGTYTLRKAQMKNQSFLKEAEAIIGAKIEVISGDEEARLIYVGASKMAKLDQKQVLIVDIGGGSTELVIGKNEQIIELVSLDMGCVSIQDQFFGDGNLSLSNFVSAITYAKSVLKPIIKRYSQVGFEQALGSSGTIRSIASIMKYSKWSQGDITLRSLDCLCAKLIETKAVNEISLPGLRVDRENILPGGFCVLYAIFDMLNITSMQQSNGALREGMLFEMVEQLKF